VNIKPSPYVPAGIDAPAVSTQTWPEPKAQTTGDRWIYEVFTPPEIYYDPATKQFTVTPPTNKIGDPPPPQPPFGVQLVQVRQDAFRLQLVGYIGGEGDYRGTFENAVSGETVIGRAGKVFPDLGLTVKTFEVKRNRILSTDSMPIYDTEATAVVVDNKTGEEVTLTNKRRLIKGEPFAVLKADGGEPVDYKAGATFSIGNARYTVGKVFAEPPSVEVTKEAPDLKESLTKTLTPHSSVDPVPVPPTPPAQPPAAPPFPFGG
jgi:hypothetical protein